MTTTPHFSYDSKCEELAKHFFPDMEPSSLKRLAQEIQDAVEDFALDEGMFLEQPPAKST